MLRLHRVTYNKLKASIKIVTTAIHVVNNFHLHVISRLQNNFRRARGTEYHQHIL